MVGIKVNHNTDICGQISINIFFTEKLKFQHLNRSFQCCRSVEFRPVQLELGDQACQLDLDHCTEFTLVCTASQLHTTFPSPSLPTVLIVLLLPASVFLSWCPPPSYFLVNHVVAPIDQIYKFSTPLFTSALWNLMQWSSGELMNRQSSR